MRHLLYLDEFRLKNILLDSFIFICYTLSTVKERN